MEFSLAIQRLREYTLTVYYIRNKCKNASNMQKFTL